MDSMFAEMDGMLGEAGRRQSLSHFITRSKYNNNKNFSLTKSLVLFPVPHILKAVCTPRETWKHSKGLTNGLPYLVLAFLILIH